MLGAMLGGASSIEQNTMLDGASSAHRHTLELRKGSIAYILSWKHLKTLGGALFGLVRFLYYCQVCSNLPYKMRFDGVLSLQCRLMKKYACASASGAWRKR